MATVNKTERKKQVSTQLVGTTLVWHRVDTGAEIGRIDHSELEEDIAGQLVVYGLKQIVADVVSAVGDMDDKLAGMRAAMDAIRAGSWPRRPASPGSMEAAITMLMVAQSISRAGALKLLGLPQED